MGNPVELPNRRGFSNISQDQLLELLDLSDSFIAGTTVDDGGCGFDALAQWLGGNHTEKSLRMICHQYYLNLAGEDGKKEVDNWIKNLGINNPNVGNSSYFLVQYTSEDLKNIGMKGESTWFVQEIDGRILCNAMPEIFPNGIHIIEITTNPESVGHYSITKAGYTQIDEESKLNGLYKLPTLVVSNRHFVSIFPKEKDLEVQDYYSKFKRAF